MDMRRDALCHAPVEAGDRESLSVPALAERVFHTSRKPALLLDPSMRVRTANRAFYETFEITAACVDERMIAELKIPGWDGASLQAHFHKLLCPNTPEDSPCESCLAGIESRIFLFNARRLDGEREEPGGIFLELEDVTDRENAREKSENDTTELRRSNSELEQFAYVASHDLQEPLRMIASYTQLLGQRYRGKLDADADDFIGFAVDGVHRMQSLIEALLTYSRVDRRGGALQETRCDDVLALTQINLRQAISESGAVITSDALPVIMADAGQIGQLFQNLVSNAMKFRAPGVTPRIHTSACRKNGNWLFSIKDNGIGIPADQGKRLFQLFYRLHTRSEYPGTGIGLALCKKIVERHGGRIWLESEPGKGCTFFFTLPPETGKAGAHDSTNHSTNRESDSRREVLSPSID